MSCTRTLSKAISRATIRHASSACLGSMAFQTELQLADIHSLVCRYMAWLTTHNLCRLCRQPGSASAAAMSDQNLTGEELLPCLQAVLNEVLGPPALRGPDGAPPAVRLHALSQDRFPSWCVGPCGCLGRKQVRGL